MKRALNSILVLLFLMSSVAAYGQGALLRRANALYDREEFYEALQVYRQIQANGNELDIEHQIKVGHCYYHLNNIDQAFDVFLNLEDHLSGYDLFVYASTYHKIGFYSMAIDLYRKARPQNPRIQGQIDELIRSCEWAERNQAYNPNVTVNPSTVLTFGQSFGIQYYDRGVVYSSASSDAENARRDRQGRVFMNLYYSDLVDGEIKNTRIFSENLVFPYHVGAISFTSDYKTMYYTRSVRVRGGSVLKVYSVVFDGKDWVNELEISINSNTFNTAHPAVSPDDRFLYFVSDRAGGYGGQDIWVVERRPNRSYGPARNLGPNVNTYGNEVFPFVSKDNVLYFSSDGHVGFGGLDLFKARNVNGEWRNVENMMFPFNSTKDDFGYVIDPNDPSRGFISTGRRGDGSVDDIFTVIWRFDDDEEETAPEPVIPIAGVPEPVRQEPVTPEPVRPQPVIEEPRVDLSIFPSSFAGIVTSSFNGGNLEGATVTLKDAFTGAEIGRSTTSANGRFSVDIPDRYRREGQEFEVVFSKNEFNPKNVTAGIMDLDEIGKAGISMTPIFKEADLNEISGLVIPYVGNEITADGYRILDRVAAYLLNNRHVVIKLNGHTDARGDRFANLNTSQSIAEKAEAYLTSKGVSPDNLIPRGYGERYIVNNCRRGKLCTDQEHLTNRRVEVVVWRFLR
ncbi:OmpA family protein [Alkaliflexus imshenetskii]|uniref:OmpA family protein n=1 Tax=Alkaliflexus imshenetskii TaxID=286730 RepID=UPI00047D76FD|nr:OmpA family protein [Alkaliflexus imshenetskii]